VRVCVHVSVCFFQIEMATISSSSANKKPTGGRIREGDKKSEASVSSSERIQKGEKAGLTLSPSSNNGGGGYSMPDPKVIGDQYDIIIEDNDYDRQLKEEEERKSQAIFDAIHDHSSLISQQEMLQLQLMKKNKEIERLMMLLDTCEPVPGLSAEKFSKLLAGSDENVDYRDSKIVDLAKKVRRLTVSINKEKQQNEASQLTISELTTKCDRLQREIDLGLLPGARTASGRSTRDRSHLLAQLNQGGESSPNDPEVDLHKARKEISVLYKNIEELKRKLADLTDENKNLSRALSRELGEGVTIEQAVDGGWRGRAQQIIMLKSKIKKMEAMAAAGLSTNNGGPQRTAASLRNDVDAKAEEDLANMTAYRKAAVEAITEENVRLQEKCSELENKQKAGKARIKNLETEINKQRGQLQIMIDKSQSDDELLEAFKEEVDKLKRQLNDLVAEKRASIRDGIGAFAKEASITQARINADGTITSTRVLTNNNNKKGDMGGPSESSPRELELQRLKRLCRQQAEQLETQDRVIQQLRQSMTSDDY
jgi:chromosome segregation ATPase